MYSCEVCNYWTYFEYELEEHTEENHPVCYSCDRIFRTHNRLRQHYLNSQYHNYCEICERDFHSPAALRGHQEIHQPRDIKCPRCDRGFPSASAMAKHQRKKRRIANELVTKRTNSDFRRQVLACVAVEQGKCFGLTHRQIVKKIRDWEVRSGNPNLLTVPRLGYSNTEGSPGTIKASEAAYNGYAYECYFCRREFGNLVSLNQHLNSAAHLSKEFRCKNCGYTATWLSGLIAHMESEKCGFLTRSQVRKLAAPIAQLRLGN